MPRIRFFCILEKKKISGGGMGIIVHIPKARPNAHEIKTGHISTKSMCVGHHDMKGVMAVDKASGYKEATRREDNMTTSSENEGTSEGVCEGWPRKTCTFLLILFSSKIFVLII
jgi:hypothetical protein